MAEAWLKIPNCEGYEASSEGRIRSTPRTVIRSNGRPHKVQGKVLSQNPNHNGYICVQIGRKSLLAHRLICEAFHGTPEPGQTDVNHKDGVRDNNRPDNLEWATRSHNVSHAIHTLGAKSGAPWSSDHERVERMRSRLSGSYVLLSPGGLKVPVTNLAAFCKERGFPVTSVRKAFTSGRAYRGWGLVAILKQGNQYRRRPSETPTVSIKEKAE